MCDSKITPAPTPCKILHYSRQLRPSQPMKAASVNNSLAWWLLCFLARSLLCRSQLAVLPISGVTTDPQPRIFSREEGEEELLQKPPRS